VNGPAEIAIVGMAAVFPGAPDVATYWANIRSGVDAISEAPADRWDPLYFDPDAAKARPGDRLYTRRGGFVTPPAFDALRFGVVPMAVPDIEADQLIALGTAAAAIDDAGGPERLGDRARVGIVLGRGGYFNSGMASFVDRVRTANQLTTTLRELFPDLTPDQLEAARAAFTERLPALREESGIDLMVPNLVASRTANRLDLGGPAYTVDAACASALIAVDHAVRELRSGRCDVMLAGGVHHCHDITFWSGFNLLGALSASGRIRPFHRDADGILIGEGTGMVVLKRLADAASDRVYAVIRGVGVAGDGRSAGLMAPRTEGQVAAMRQAWADARLDPLEAGGVGLVEAHGTATVAGDATELASLGTVFGPPTAGGPDIGIGSVKSMIGHAMPAAGIAGLIKAALALHERVLPPTLHCEDPHPSLAGSRFAPITVARDWVSDGPRRAAVNAFGFGGINAHVVLAENPIGATGIHRAAGRPGAELTRPAALDRAGEPGPERVLLIAGPTIDAVAAVLAHPDAELLARDDAAAPPSTGAVRLAVVAPDPRRLELARRILAQGRSWSGRSDVWFATEPLLGARPDGTRAGQLAFLFPGLEESFAPRVDDVAAHFGLPPVRSSAAPGLGRRGLELAAVGRLLNAALLAIDVQPDVVAGHSIGEWSALIASGAAPFEEFADSTRAFDAGPGVPDLVFAVLGCGAGRAVEAIGDSPDVVLSHDNCPHQSIICGEESTVATVLERLRETGVTGSILPFRSGFHTPYLAPFLGPTEEFVRGLTLRQARVPLWSATTVERYPEHPEEIRALLLRNLVEPVRFRPLIERLYAEGVRVFVQVGTGSLPGFVEDCLESGGLPYLALTANVPRRNGLDQLRRVAAALWAVGATPRFTRLGPGDPAGAPPEGTAPSRTAAELPGEAHLRLGAPLVRGVSLRLDAARESQSAEAALAWPHGAPPEPVLAEYAGLLADVEAAAAEVLAAWRPAPTEPAAAPGSGPTEATGPRSRTVSRRLSLELDTYLADHCLLQAPPDRPIAERYPIVPMTTTVELLIQAAAELISDRVVVGVRGVRALRPLVVDPQLELVIEATERVEGDGEPGVVGVVIDGVSGDGTRETYARGTVLVAADYPTPPELRRPQLTGERPASADAHTLYADRWMFHGPAYRGVSGLGPIAEDGIRGTVTALPAPGALLDAAGQLLGYWVGIQSQNAVVLPATIGSISFYGPEPRPGAELAVVVRIRELGPDEVVADLELRDHDGRLWSHITGWTDRRLEGNDRTIAAFRHPDRTVLAERQPGGWWLLAEPWADPVARDLTCRQYLTTAERADHDGRNPRAARRWLLGRIAAKDALRSALWDRGAGPIFPAEVTIGNDPTGRPFAVGAGAEDLAVSVAHSGPLAAAMVGPAGTAVGIDLELVEDAPAESALLTPAERGLLDRIAPGGGAERAGWVTRFWTAKEAVAKAGGTGLGGRPARFVVTATDGDRLLVVVDGAEHWVATQLGDAPLPFAVGWTPVSEMLGP